jgi:hypothetical protein
MGGSRTVRKLTFLLIAMTFGVLALMLLETEPVHPNAQPLAVLAPPPAGAGKVVYETRVPLQAVKWRYMVVHAAPTSSARPAASCHFIVDAEGDIQATAHWIGQRDAAHVGGFWREHSIGVCLVGDFSRHRPAAGQFARLVELVNTLQEVCRIPAGRVYLHSDLVAYSGSPGAAFPAEEFSARLLRPRR